MIVLYIGGRLCLSKDGAPGKTGAFFALKKVAPTLVLVKEDKKHQNTRAGDFLHSRLALLSITEPGPSGSFILKPASVAFGAVAPAPE